MYPQPDLNVLALRKHALLRRIRSRRAECAAQTVEVLKPAVWAEGVYMKWRAIPPLAKLAAMPVGMVLLRKFTPKIGGLLSWAPLAMNLFRAFR